MDYRQWLEKDVIDNSDDPIGLQWQVAACNAIRQVLQDKPLDPVFWDRLKESTQQQLECVLSVSTE